VDRNRRIGNMQTAWLAHVLRVEQGIASHDMLDRGFTLLPVYVSATALRPSLSCSVFSMRLPCLPVLSG
jgi:hypothetical protein